MLLISIMNFGLTIFQGIGGLYVLDKFNFDTRQIGMMCMVVGGVMVLSQSLLTGPLTKSIGEVWSIRVGMLMGTFGFVALLLANGFLSILLAAGLFILVLALANPALNSFLSTFGGKHQSPLMGLKMAFASLSRGIGPMWAGFVFDINIAYPFTSGIVVLLIGFIASLIGMRIVSPKPADATISLPGVGD